jgi:hypothetical protein
MIPTSERSKDSRPRARARDLVIREWFGRLAENFDYVPSNELVNVWITGLCDLDSETLAHAFEKVFKTWKPEYGRRFPVVADIREQIDEAQAKAFELEADEAFEKALNVATEFFQPDIGLYRNAPKLSPAAWHALKAAGGLEHLQSCSREELQWARKRFIANYTLIHETHQVEHLLGDGEAKNRLSRILSGPASPERKRLTAVESEDEFPPRAEVRAVLERVIKKPVAANDESWEHQKRRAREWAIERGYAVEQSAAGAGDKSPIPEHA